MKKKNIIDLTESDLDFIDNSPTSEKRLFTNKYYNEIGKLIDKMSHANNNNYHTYSMSSYEVIITPKKYKYVKKNKIRKIHFLIACFLICCFCFVLSLIILMIILIILLLSKKNVFYWNKSNTNSILNWKIIISGLIKILI